MQPVTGGPRAALTAAAVVELVQADAVELAAGVDLYDVLTGEWTLDVDTFDPDGSEVARSCYATIHGTCRLRFTDAYRWGSTLARPWLVLDDGTTRARFDLGLYELATAPATTGDTPAVYEVEGYDLLAKLRWNIGTTWTADAGTGALAAVLELLDAAGVDGYGTILAGLGDDPELTTTRVWPIGPDVTYRTAIGELLDSIGYRGLWTDWNGRYRSEPYASPTVRPVEWTYDADDPLVTIMSPTSETVADLYDVPNRWTVIRDDPAQDAPTIGNGGVVVVENLDDGPTSQAATGEIRGIVVLVQADTPAAVTAQAVQLAERGRSVETYRTVITEPNPLHWHMDVVELVENGDRSRWLVTDWTLPLDGGPMVHRWRSITVGGTT